MAMDETDKRLVNGLIYLTVLGALAYFVPVFGYQDLKKKELEARNRLEQKSTTWNRYYHPIHPVHFGDYSAEPPPSLSGRYMHLLKEQYGKTIEETQKLIDLKQQASRMNFPEWTEVPANEKREPGVYFQMMWQRKREQIRTRLIESKVECLDDDVGFGQYKGKVNIPINEAEEQLRKLFIAEKMIELCMQAKVREEIDEKNRGVVPEAYMKIVAVQPHPSVAAGPSALIPNPKYNPDEKNPNSERFRKYNVRMWKSFIQEYPVEIKLQCDVNTFMRFLHSVRAPGQFLVIRNLEMLSPFLDESQEDRTELNVFNPDHEKEKLDPSKKLSVKEEHVLVRISAAGMDFFDPVKFPRGLYDNGKTPVRVGPVKKKYSIPTE
ncbi:MAG TPA: hypothetical protein VEK08_10260 [Planctomycetota bacterium]|nr:hypothetical protein [Planctomycetota bacterium]